MTKMPKFKRQVNRIPVDLGYGNNDEFTLAELKERILSRQDMVYAADPIDIDTVKIELEHDYDRDGCWVNLKVIMTQTLTVEAQEEQWRQTQKANAKHAKNAQKARDEHERREYERLKKKYGEDT